MEPLIHYVLPFTALILLGEKPKDAAIIALLGLVPDIDALLNIHRSISHSIPIISLIFLPMFILFRLRFHDKVRTLWIAYFTTISHIILDLGASTPIFWPLYKPITIRFEVFPPSFLHVDYPLFTQDGVLITLILFIPVIYRILLAPKQSM